MDYRFERKFFVSFAGYTALKARLLNGLNPDIHASQDGMYKIRSLYFDNYMSSALLEKLSGVDLREKYRIRFYDMDDSFIRLEVKQKNGEMIRKLTAPLDRGQVELILDGDISFLYDSEHDLLKRFFAKCRTELFKPAVIVDYDREAYIYNDVRITFDHNVHTSNYNCNLFDPDVPTIPVLPPDRVILEVKYNERLPDFINKLLQPISSSISAISKYELCRQFQ